jgi:isopenicillin-N epimerase
VCHITNRTGQIFPVKRIAEMAHARGITVICDGAHAFSQFPYKISDLDVDYYGVSLHKWTYAPVGTGFLYVRKSRIASTWSMMASGETQKNDIRKFEEIGTHPAANFNAISEALIFNREYRHRPQGRAAPLPARPLGPPAGARIPSAASCTVPTRRSPAASVSWPSTRSTPARVASALVSKYAIYTAVMNHEEYTGLRITPNIYTPVHDIDFFAEAVEARTEDGISPLLLSEPRA